MHSGNFQCSMFVSVTAVFKCCGAGTVSESLNFQCVNRMLSHKFLLSLEHNLITSIPLAVDKKNYFEH